MNFCEFEFRVQNENALRFPIVSQPAPLLEYIKTVSSLVGASHVLGVFEENDTIKIYFDDKRHFDSIIKSGIHVMGRHLRADYVVPPGTKVVLTNVDPVISNSDLTRLLNMHGTVVSPVVRLPLSDDVDLCHIGYGARYVYMLLNETLPHKLQYKYGHHLCYIKTSVEDMPMLVPNIKLDCQENAENNTEPTNPEPCPGPSNVLLSNSDVPVVVSVQSNAQNISDEKDKCCKLQKKETSGLRFSKRNRKSLLHLKHKRTATSQAAAKITKNVKNKLNGKKLRHFKKRGRPRQPQINKSSPPSSGSSSPDEFIIVPLTIGGQASPCHEEIVLDTETLDQFLEEVRHHRAPIEVAKKYLGAECDAAKLRCLISQLRKYNNSHNLQNSKTRIERLIKSLVSSM